MRPSPPSTTGLSPPDQRHRSLIDLTVWESGESPLLAPPTAKSVDLKAAQVSANGAIYLPFIGAMRLRGLPPEQARETIQKQMEGSLDAPKVQINVTPGRQNTVDLIGGVPRAGSFPLPDRGFSVLGLLGWGGGIAQSADAADTQRQGL